jgi:hypothetical protein
MASFARRHLLNITGTVTTASFLGAVRPVRVARAAEGGPAWNVKGDHLYARPCEVACPCDFDSPPSAGYCTVLSVYHIESGRYGEVTPGRVKRGKNHPLAWTHGERRFQGGVLS